MATKKGSAAKPTKPKPATKIEPQEYHKTRRGVIGQVCLACDRWRPLTEYSRKSAARGGQPIRVCRSCITEQARARREGKS